MAYDYGHGYRPNRPPFNQPQRFPRAPRSFSDFTPRPRPNFTRESRPVFAPRPSFSPQSIARSPYHYFAPNRFPFKQTEPAQVGQQTNPYSNGSQTPKVESSKTTPGDVKETPNQGKSELYKSENETKSNNEAKVGENKSHNGSTHIAKNEASVDQSRHVDMDIDDVDMDIDEDDDTGDINAYDVSFDGHGENFQYNDDIDPREAERIYEEEMNKKNQKISFTPDTEKSKLTPNTEKSTLVKNPSVKETKQDDSKKDIKTLVPQQKKDGEQDRRDDEEEEEESDEENTEYCDYCKMEFSNPDSYWKHTRGLLHTQRLMEAEKAKKGGFDDEYDIQTGSVKEIASSSYVPKRGELVTAISIEKDDTSRSLQDIAYETFPGNQKIKSHYLQESFESQTEGYESYAGYEDEGGGGDDYYEENYEAENWMAAEVEEENNKKKLQASERNLAPDECGKNQFPDEYHCKLCDAKCTGAVTYKMHLDGRQHKLKVEAASKGETLKAKKAAKMAVLGGGKCIDVDKEPKINAQLEQCDSPIIGLEFVTEYQKDDEKATTRYVCNICEAKCDMATIISHMVGIRHRMAVFKTCHPAIHFHLNQFTSSRKKSEQNASAELFAKDVEDKEGRGSVKVKMEIDPTTEQAAIHLIKSAVIKIPELMSYKGENEETDSKVSNGGRGKSKDSRLGFEESYDQDSSYGNIYSTSKMKPGGLSIREKMIESARGRGRGAMKLGYYDASESYGYVAEEQYDYGHGQLKGKSSRFSPEGGGEYGDYYGNEEEYGSQYSKYGNHSRSYDEEWEQPPKKILKKGQRDEWESDSNSRSSLGYGESSEGRQPGNKQSNQSTPDMPGMFEDKDKKLFLQFLQFKKMMEGGGGDLSSVFGGGSPGQIKSERYEETGFDKRQPPQSRGPEIQGVQKFDYGHGSSNPHTVSEHLASSSNQPATKDLKQEIIQSQSSAGAEIEGKDNEQSKITDMLSSLSNSLICTEEEAEMALQVSNALTQALLQYRLKKLPQELKTSGKKQQSSTGQQQTQKQPQSQQQVSKSSTTSSQKVVTQSKENTTRSKEKQTAQKPTTSQTKPQSSEQKPSTANKVSTSVTQVSTSSSVKSSKSKSSSVPTKEADVRNMLKSIDPADLQKILGSIQNQQGIPPTTRPSDVTELLKTINPADLQRALNSVQNQAVHTSSSRASYPVQSQPVHSSSSRASYPVQSQPVHSSSSTASSSAPSQSGHSSSIKAPDIKHLIDTINPAELQKTLNAAQNQTKQSTSSINPDIQNVMNTINPADLLKLSAALQKATSQATSQSQPSAPSPQQHMMMSSHNMVTITQKQMMMSQQTMTPQQQMMMSQGQDPNQQQYMMPQYMMASQYGMQPATTSGYPTVGGIQPHSNILQGGQPVPSGVPHPHQGVPTTQHGVLTPQGVAPPQQGVPLPHQGGFLPHQSGPPAQGMHMSYQGGPGPHPQQVGSHSHQGIAPQGQGIPHQQGMSQNRGAPPLGFTPQPPSGPPPPPNSKPPLPPPNQQY